MISHSELLWHLNSSKKYKNLKICNAMYTVLTGRVTKSTVVVCMVAQNESNVTKVYGFVSQKRTNTLITVFAFNIYMILSLLTKYWYIFYSLFFFIMNYATSSSNNLHVTVAILVCAGVLIIPGVVITIYVIR